MSNQTEGKNKQNNNEIPNCGSPFCPIHGFPELFIPLVMEMRRTFPQRQRRVVIIEVLSFDNVFVGSEDEEEEPA